MSISTIETLISHINNNLENMEYQLWYFGARLNQAGISGQSGDVVAMGGGLRTASSIMNSFRAYFFTNGGTYDNLGENLSDVLTNIKNELDGGGSEVDMDSILSAMVTASFEQITQFMGLTQAYKTAVWDAPFNEEYYAALARGFKTWGA